MTEQKYTGNPTGLFFNGKEILENNNTFFTEDNEFTLWKNFLGYKIDMEGLSTLLNNGVLESLDLTKKDGSKFTSSINMVDGKIQFYKKESNDGEEIEFNGEKLKNYEKSYYLASKKINFWKIIGGHTLTKNEILDILKNGKTGVINDFFSPKKNENFTGILKIDGDKVVIDYNVE